MRKIQLLLVAFLLMASTASAQKRAKYEFMRNLPVYADSLIAHFDYPFAWENSGIKKFGKWKKIARQKVFDCMLMPPPPPAGGYQTKVLFEEQRDGYKAQKIEIRLSQYYTVPAYVLVPDGKGPFPAINLLHDHGAHLYIGKEKMIRPLACEEAAVVKDADEQLSFKYDRTENGGFANCFPGLRRWMDYPHVASIACPKPMLFINGKQDKLFPVPGVEKAFAIMHNTWRSQGADDNLETELWDIPHSCGLNAQQRVLEFFKKHL